MTHQAHIAHHIPGRIRIKLPGAKGNPTLLQQIKESISPLPGVKQVHVNPVTGSVLIHYDSELHEDFHSHLTEHARSAELFALGLPKLSEVEEVAENIEAEAEFLAEHSETARSIVNFFKRLNEDIRRATDNTVDLKVLLPLGVALYALFWTDKKRNAPLWVSLLIFSFNSFVHLHRPKPSVHVGEKEVFFKDARAAQRKGANSTSERNGKRK